MSDHFYLLVDDDPVFNQVLGRTFSKRNIENALANDEQSAIDAAQKHPITRAVLDLKLEHTSGLHLIEQLRAINPDMNIVILTGYSSINTAVEAMKLGATNYLCKPADADQILAAFDEVQGDPNIEISDNPPSVNRLEWEHIQKVLHDNNNNISATARALGMHRRTLQRKLQKRPTKT